MKRFKTIEDVWTALDAGKKVHWSNDSYKLYVEPILYGESRAYQRNHFTHRNGQVLAARCIANYFGSLLNENELSALYTNEEN